MNAWKKQLRANVIAKVKELKAEGVVSMSVDNLSMLVKVPSGGPVGNARWVLMENMREIARTIPGKFIQ